MWEQPKECVCSVPATLIQQTSFGATQVLSSCQSAFHSPSSLGCPPRLSWKSLCRAAEWSRGYHQRERQSKYAVTVGSQQAGPLYADVVHRFRNQPSLCTFLQPVLDRVGIATPVQHLPEEGRATGKTLCHQILPHCISSRVSPQLLLFTHPLPQAQIRCSVEASS